MHRLFLLAMTALVSTFILSAWARQPEPPAPAIQADRASPGARSADPGYVGLITSDRQQGGRGVRVMHVDRGSPADEAGIKEGDMIVGIGDRPIAFSADMREALRGAQPGAKLTFKVDRAGSTKEREITLGKRPAQTEQKLPFGRIPEDLPPPPGFVPPSSIPPAGTIPPPAAVPPPAEPPIERDPALAPPPSDTAPATRSDPESPPHSTAYLGVRTVPVTERDRWQLELPLRLGAKVTAVSVGSPADRSGVPLLAVIVAVNGKPVVSPTDLAGRIATFPAGEEVELSLYYRGEAVRRRVILGSTADSPAIGEGPRSAERLAPAPAVSADSRRIDELSREVADLAARIAKLEEALRKSPAPKPPAPADQP
jgi:predicted metalloprotease with PDZ domain